MRTCMERFVKLVGSLRGKRSSLLLMVFLLGGAGAFAQDALTPPSPDPSCGGEHQQACPYGKVILSGTTDPARPGFSEKGSKPLNTQVLPAPYITSPGDYAAPTEKQRLDKLELQMQTIIKLMLIFDKEITELQHPKPKVIPADNPRHPESD